MNTKVLEYVIAIAEEGSLSRAAERFYLTHAALSRHLKNIEEELGKPLFLRLGGGMQPTSAGLIFISDARAILHTEQKLTQTLATMRQQKQHVIRVMVDMAFYNRFVKLVMPRFSERHPEYTVELARCNATEACEALRRGEAMLGVFFSAGQQAPGLVYLTFLSSHMLLVFPKDYRGSADIEGLRKALDEGMFMSLYPTGSTPRVLVQQRLAAAQIYPKRVMEGESRTIVGHVIAGNACCVLPEYFRAHAEQDGLVIGDRFCSMNHVLAYSADAALSPAAQELMQIIIEVFSAF